MQRSIEILIGRLVTDEDFRAAFRRDSRAALVNAGVWGLEISAGEVGALLDTDPTLWDRVARELDWRLQKASLRAPAGPGCSPLEHYRRTPTASGRMTLFSQRRLVIEASPEVVWKVHTDIEAWSRWHRSVSSARLVTPLAVGSEFEWKSGGLTIASTVQTLEPHRRMSWTGTSLGTRAHHTWLLQPHNAGTLLTTEESMTGWLVSLLKLLDPRFLDRSLEAWLHDLAQAANNDGSEDGRSA